MFPRENFSAAVPALMQSTIKVTLLNRYQKLLGEVTKSERRVSFINQLSDSINMAIKAQHLCHTRIREFESYQAHFIDAFKTIFDVDFVENYLDVNSQKLATNSLVNVFNCYENLAISQSAFRHKNMIDLMTSTESLSLNRIKRRIYRVVLDSLVAVIGSFQRAEIIVLCNEIFYLNNHIIQIKEIIRERFNLSPVEWNFIQDLVMVIHDVEVLQTSFLTNINAARLALLNPFSMQVTMENLVANHDNLSGSLSKEYFISKCINLTPHVYIPGFHYLWNRMVYLDLVNRVNKLNVHVADQIAIRSLAEQKSFITTIGINNFVKVMHQTILQAAYLYDSANVDDGGILYYLYHGMSGRKRISRLLEKFNETSIADIEKLKYLVSFLKRHKTDAGLRSHSFDTHLLSLLYEEPKGVLGRFSFFSQNGIGNRIAINIAEVHRSAQARHNEAKGFIANLVKGRERLEKSSDRKIIRDNTSITLFNLSHALDKYSLSLNKLSTVPRIR